MDSPSRWRGRYGPRLRRLSIHGAATASFPGGRIRREWPITHRLETGTVVAGAADLIVETGDHVAIVDHKSVVTHAGVLEKAEGFAGQLACYAEATMAMGGGKTVSTWVHLPLAGMVVGVTPV